MKHSYMGLGKNRKIIWNENVVVLQALVVVVVPAWS